MQKSMSFSNFAIAKKKWQHLSCESKHEVVTKIYLEKKKTKQQNMGEIFAVIILMKITKSQKNAENIKKT